MLRGKPSGLGSKLPLRSDNRRQAVRLLEDLRAALLHGDPDEWAKATYALDSYLLEMGVLPGELFVGLMELINLSEFRELPDSFLLCRVLEQNFASLSEDQQISLLRVLEQSYAQFADWLSCFFVSEMIGEWYDEETAYEVLAHLKKTEKSVPRSLVAHGFEHLHNRCSDSGLAQRVVKVLREMERDRSPQVRQEAGEALRAIRRPRTS